MSRAGVVRIRHNGVPPASRAVPSEMELTPFNLGIAMSAGVVVVGYVMYILVPAWSCYGRLWERLAASFLSLFILVTLLGLGLSIGFSLVWFYDTYA